MRKQANFKLPEELLTALQNRAAEERTSGTDLVIQALKAFLSEPANEGSKIGSTIYDIADCIEELKDRVDKLEGSKSFYFMYNSPSCEATDVDIRIDSDSLIPNSSEENIMLLSRVEELAKQNESLHERLAALEALVQEYNYQALSRSTTREFQ